MKPNNSSFGWKLQPLRCSFLATQERQSPKLFLCVTHPAPLPLQGGKRAACHRYLQQTDPLANPSRVVLRPREPWAPPCSVPPLYRGRGWGPASTRLTWASRLLPQRRPHFSLDFSTGGAGLPDRWVLSEGGNHFPWPCYLSRKHQVGKVKGSGKEHPAVSLDLHSPLQQAARPHGRAKLCFWTSASVRRGKSLLDAQRTQGGQLPVPVSLLQRTRWPWLSRETAHHLSHLCGRVYMDYKIAHRKK